LRARDDDVAARDPTSSSGPCRASGTVLESPDHGPQLCHAVAESYPPQCPGLEVVGWNWAAVDGEEFAGGTTWGAYEVTGTVEAEVVLADGGLEAGYDSRCGPGTVVVTGWLQPVT
jgi:hypothetical protein